MCKIGLTLLALLCIEVCFAMLQNSNKADSLMKSGEWELAAAQLLKDEQKARQNQNTSLFELSKVKRAQCLYQLNLFDSAKIVLEEQIFVKAQSQILKHQLLGDLALASGSGGVLAWTEYHRSMGIAKTTQSNPETQSTLLSRFCDLFINQRNTDSTRHYLEKFFKLIPELEDPLVAQARYYNVLGTVHRFEGQPDSTLYYYHKAKTLLSSLENSSPSQSIYLADLYENLASLYAEMAEVDSQLYYGAAQLALLEQNPLVSFTSLATAYGQRANDLYAIGQVEGAENYVDKAIQLYLNMGDMEDVGLGSIYILKASLITYQYWEYNRALELQKEAIRIFEKTYGPGHRQTARPYWELGRTYELLEQNGLAINCHEKALAIALANKDYERINKARFYLGESLVKAGRYYEAKEHFSKAKAMIHQAFGPDYFANALLNTGLATVQAKTGDSERAEKTFREAERVMLLNYGEVDPRLANLYRYMGDLYQGWGQVDKAIAFYQKTVNTNKTFLDNGQERVADYSMNIQARSGHAKLLRVKFKEDQDWAYIDKINHLLFENLESLRFLMSRTNPGSDLTALSDQYRSTYDELIAIGLIQYDAYQTEAQKEHLFNMSENARSVLRALRTHQMNLAKRFTEDMMSISLADQIKTLRGQIESTDPNSHTYVELSRKLVRLNADRENLLRAKEALPDELNGLEPIYLDSVQRSLATNQRLIEFQKLEDGYLVFVVSDKDYHLARLNLEMEQLQNWLRTFDESLRQHDVASFQQSSHSLYQHLLQPVEAYLDSERLIVVPDDLLWNVHFDLLVNEYSPEVNRFKDLNFLLKKHSIAHAYSARSTLEKSDLTRHNKSLMAFSYDVKTTQTPELDVMRNSDLSDLPGTAVEIARIKKRIEADVFYGNEANEAVFKDQAPDYQVLHLALHAIVDSANYKNAWLQFLPQKNQEVNDGKLQAFELYNVRLNADLVVLSACNSGKGKYYRGEGIAGLGSAFIYAGAKSVLLSKWEVSDATSPDLMDSFYRYLKQGLTRDKALQQAKLSFLESANNLSENPLYWGSFYLIGDSGAISLQAPKKYKGMWLAGLFAMLATIAFILIRRTRQVRISPA